MFYNMIKPGEGGVEEDSDDDDTSGKGFKII